MGTSKIQAEADSSSSKTGPSTDVVRATQEQQSGPVPINKKFSPLPQSSRTSSGVMAFPLSHGSGRARISTMIQRQLGNARLSRIMNGPQAKIPVGPAGDRYEQEADEVASRIVSGQKVARISRTALGGQALPVERQPEEEEEEETPAPNTALQHQPEEEEEEETPAPSTALQRQSEEEEEEEETAAPSTALQRQAEEEEEEETADNMAIQSIPYQINASSDGDNEVSDAGTESRIKSPGGGRPLPEGIRTEMESGLGADFSAVRVHDSSEDQATAKGLNAKAFAYRDNIWMGPGASTGDRKLMAHELTHVVQQGDVRSISQESGIDIHRQASAPPIIQLSPLSDELEQVWLDQGKGPFFQRLRTLGVSDPDVHRFVESSLTGDDLWLARNLLNHGPEANWPIHLRVEREMKGWGDSGGKGVVFDILRTANGAESANAALSASLSRVFAAGSDDIWLGLNLQSYGLEANWPIHLRVEREMKGWGDSGGKGVVFDILRTANGAESANAALSASLNRVFAAGSDDIWLAQNLQLYGPEANWPQHGGTRIPDTATQAAISSELYPARGAVGAPVAWDGALTAGMTPAQRTAALAARTALVNEMNTALNAYLTATMPGITATAGRRRVPIAALEGAGQAAKADADAQFGGYATASALTVPQEAARAAYTISASGAGQNLFDAQDPADRTTVGMGIDPTDLASWMAETVPGCVTARTTHHLDPTRSAEERNFLRTQIVAPFVAANDADLRAFDLHGFALSNPRTGQIVLPTSVPGGLSDVAPALGVPSEAERGRKWRAWRTMVHEYIHQLEHPALRAWPGSNRTITEGFTEYFTKKILLPLLPTAAGTSVTRRVRIEGADNGAPSSAVIGGAYSPGSYANYLARVENIEGHLGGAAVGAQRAMKAIFFQGHIEYLGYDTQGNPLTAPAGPQDQITVPASITTFAALAIATNVAQADLRSANPGMTEPLSGRMRAPGCREHRVVIAGARGSGARGETLSIIATQHVVNPSALRAANPGVNFATLGEGDVVIIPRH